MAFSSDRILTIHELKEGDIVHSGFSGGRCIKWTVVAKSEFRAFLQHKNGTVCNVDGPQLRQWDTYRENDCPKCELQQSIDVQSPEIRFMRQSIGSSAVESSFRFSPAQHVIRRRYK